MNATKTSTTNNSVTSQSVRHSINARIAEDISATKAQVESACKLLDSGATVPFISRYRKEATGGLSDSQLRLLEERLSYLRELESRRATILESIDSQGKLDDKLNAKLLAATTKSELEDLYLPYRQKRKTKGSIAIEAGLEPLADSLWSDPSQNPESAAATFVNSDLGVEDSKAALEGARYILMERYAEDAALLSRLRELLKTKSYLCSTLSRGKEAEGEKFQNYFDFQELIEKVPSHRALAMFRGRSEGILSLNLKLKQADGEFGVDECIRVVAQHVGFTHTKAAADDWREQVVQWTWKVKLSHHLESDLFLSLRERAEAEAIRVFASNLRDLLLAAPAGERCTLGLDPGYRSGVKVAVTDKTGKLLDFTTIYPHQPQKQWDKALNEITALCKKHNVELIATGNGTASRETDQFAAEVIKMVGNPGLLKVVVSEAGASVYSASVTAEQEFPSIDVTIRGAISIARRLQDPLAELVKIDPKAIGVGQYQHDVSQLALARSLDATVEDCVNSVGVDLNTASSALLERVAGVGNTIATNIVEFRDQNGPFEDLKGLGKVPRLGPKAFEQCAGFLRIANGKNPLDASGVHPEAYPVVKKIVSSTSKSLADLIGDTGTLKAVNAKDFIDEKFGLPTIQDILLELDKPGRDPRPAFQTVNFADGVDSIKDLKPNQILEGQVTNVTNFGAFVDVGVHQDGLVHISSMSEQYIKDPHQVVKAGDIVKVKVMSVEAERKRIGLSMRLSDDADNAERSGNQRSGNQRSGNQHSGEKRADKSRSENGGTKHQNKESSHHKNKNQVANNRENANQSTPSALALALQKSLDKTK